jgi:uncharacterized membrane protein
MRQDHRHTLISTALVSLLLLGTAFSCTSRPHYPPAPVQGNAISIDTASLEDGVPRFFSYRFQDRDISFFILKLGNRVLSFLDACVTCYPRALGYRYENGHLNCRACNLDFSVFKLEKGIGGCYPIKIEGRLEGGMYMIPTGELQKHARKF